MWGRMTERAYEKDGAAIYRASFAIIRKEAKLARFAPLEERVAVRVIHACGQVEVADDIVFTSGGAAALDLWGERLAGALVAIGNAPTALFRLLDMIAAGAPRPAAIIGVPVGFVGAAESKEALLASGLPAIVVRGRKGGSAMAAAAVNALASERE